MATKLYTGSTTPVKKKSLTVAYLRESGRDPEFSTIYGRMYNEEAKMSFIKYPPRIERTKHTVLYIYARLITTRRAILAIHRAQSLLETLCWLEDELDPRYLAQRWQKTVRDADPPEKMTDSMLTAIFLVDLSAEAGGRARSYIVTRIHR
ncbi:hypothetical protein B0T26DRAFT_677776 [Lasiosphaeria miniovina]|uniref:Uncharacterized protein n=1 Tax=Lasiosphaeria miniovina TaxID=1954250 RepID=A0AA40ACV8_9PEZI|nr:uncharacterized protein B0T26DRAFT_677776 [Lasiosphaeria miniovina]KAK0713439.1 hypothetical protein B0T26DRAFT_677776 [Lasiosphaeria miniovina]